MRMRRKQYRAEVLSQHQDILENDPAAWQGNWKQRLGCTSLHVELGSGKGDYLLGMAKLFPESGWIAIERNLDIVALALRKATGQALANICWIAADAKDLALWFAPQEIAVIHLNFSDPWPKNAHTKRRLTAESFLSSYYTLLETGGTVILKSDNADLMEYSRRVLPRNGFTLVESSDDYRSISHPQEVISEYEARFIQQGQPIYQTKWQVNK